MRLIRRLISMAKILNLSPAKVDNHTNLPHIPDHDTDDDRSNVHKYFFTPSKPHLNTSKPSFFASSKLS